MPNQLPLHAPSALRVSLPRCAALCHGSALRRCCRACWMHSSSLAPSCEPLWSQMPRRWPLKGWCHRVGHACIAVPCLPCVRCRVIASCPSHGPCPPCVPCQLWVTHYLPACLHAWYGYCTCLAACALPIRQGLSSHLFLAVGPVHFHRYAMQYPRLAP